VLADADADASAFCGFQMNWPRVTKGTCHVDYKFMYGPEAPEVSNTGEVMHVAVE
jgi:hypothetical protein